MKLSVRQEFGDVVHEAVVLTEPPQQEELVLRTMARACPSIRIEEATPTDGLVLVTSDQPRRVKFRVFAYGSPNEPPADLDHVRLCSTIKAEWAGPREESPSEDGLRAVTRRFTASLDPARPTGENRAEILFQDGERVLYRHVVAWEVVPSIAASPKVVVIRAGQRAYRVVIRSEDQKPFRIARIECRVPGIRGLAENTAAARMQTVEVVSEGDLRPEGGRGVITVFTDHPAQGRFDLPFVVLD